MRYDTIAGVIVSPPAPNCGHISTTFTHDVIRSFWLCARCRSTQGLAPGSRCQRCGRRCADAGPVERTQAGDRACVGCRREFRRERLSALVRR